MAPRKSKKTPDAPADDETTNANAEARAEKAGAEAEDEDDDAIAADDSDDEPRVKVRVLKKGHGKIATGKFSRAQNAFTYHKRGDVVELPQSVAEAQENNGHVEIVD